MDFFDKQGNPIVFDNSAEPKIQEPKNVPPGFKTLLEDISNDIFVSELMRLGFESVVPLDTMIENARHRDGKVLCEVYLWKPCDITPKMVVASPSEIRNSVYGRNTKSESEKYFEKFGLNAAYPVAFKNLDEIVKLIPTSMGSFPNSDFESHYQREAIFSKKLLSGFKSQNITGILIKVFFMKNRDELKYVPRYGTADAYITTKKGNIHIHTTPSPLEFDDLKDTDLEKDRFFHYCMGDFWHDLSKDTKNPLLAYKGREYAHMFMDTFNIVHIESANQMNSNLQKCIIVELFADFFEYYDMIHNEEPEELNEMFRRPFYEGF